MLQPSRAISLQTSCSQSIRRGYTPETGTCQVIYILSYEYLYNLDKPNIIFICRTASHTPAKSIIALYLYLFDFYACSLWGLARSKKISHSYRYPTVCKI
jgi:hypothetical protein